MIAAFDTFYGSETATTAAIIFEWDSTHPINIYIHSQPCTEPYKSGEFYRRELPCILETLKQVEEPLETVVVDSFVFLDDLETPGMGARLYNCLGGKVAVVGCAKNPLKHCTAAARAVYRGKSQKPLWVSAIGIDLGFAANSIQNMAGEYRLPTLLKAADSYCRDASLRISPLLSCRAPP